MLSTIVLTKNEEKNIKECLESIKNLGDELIGDELIIVDTFSSDRTVEIVRKFTNNIYQIRFDGDFSKLRNYALDHSKGEWILFVDADERVSDNLRKILPSLLRTNKYEGYLIPRRNYINKNEWLHYGLFYPDYQLRLFRNRGVRYSGRIHEFPSINIKKTKKIQEFLIHNDTRSKYSNITSIKRLIRDDDNRIKNEALGLLRQNKSSVYYVANGFYLGTKYFIEGYILGKGYLDGYKGLRAHIIFSLITILVTFHALFLRYKIIK